jgi:predicted membrane protein
MDDRNTQNYTHSSSSRMLVGLIFIFGGILFLLDNLNFINIDIGSLIFPSILIIVGITRLMHSRKKLFGTLLVVAGVLIILPQIIRPWYYLSGHIVFPILIIIIGLYFILRKRNGSTSNHNHNGYRDSFFHEELDINRIDDIAIFGGGHKVISSDNFQGGNITAIFGGSEIDLTQCKLAPGKNVLDIVAIFGGTTLIVPKDWNIMIDVIPLFGGFSNKVRNTPDVVIDTEKTLIIKGLLLFGGGEVKAY